MNRFLFILNLALIAGLVPWKPGGHRIPPVQSYDQGDSANPPRVFLPFVVQRKSGQQSLSPVGKAGGSWALTFQDEFNGTKLDRSKWRTDYWNGGNGELQEYVNDDQHKNYIVQNGILRIVARKESYQGKRFTSGVITTQERFAQKYGFMEIRAKVPAGKGLWSAFWLLPNPNGWPPEIDIMEYIGGENNVIYMTLHYRGAQTRHLETQDYFKSSNFSMGWHTFGVEWRPDAIIWYIDGVERKRVSNSAIIPSMPMYLLANFAVGGQWPGSPDSNTKFPAYYDIDYIRVYKNTGS